MRQKTEAKREAIIKAAAELFKEVGFDRTSMSEIAARVGGSKATLYSYFKSKEELLLAVMTGTALTTSQEMVAQRTGVVIAALTALEGEDLRSQLERLTIAVLSLASSPDMLALRRLVQAHGGERGPSQIFFERGPKQLYLRIAAFLEQAMKDGRLRESDPWVTTMHLKGLLESEYIDRLMTGHVAALTTEMIRDAAKRAVDVFWRAYARER